ncbi:MAG: Maf family protein [bacterium]|nr:Maf family protein [bacterium]
MRVILASASPRRKELLAQIGIQAEICPSSIEEKVSSTQPQEVVAELSRQKAEDVYQTIEEGKKIEETESRGVVVIGADTIVVCDGKILGKPKNHEEAYRMIEGIQGRTHQVYTGVTLIGKNEKGEESHLSFVEETDVEVYPMIAEEVLAYTSSQEPMDKAGAYGIQGSFAAYIKSIHGDYNSVVGLPVGRVFQEIKKNWGNPI